MMLREKEADLRRLQTARFQPHDVLEKAEPGRPPRDQGWGGRGGGGGGAGIGQGRLGS